MMTLYEHAKPDPDRNDYNHPQNEPWQSLGQIQADLRRARGSLKRALKDLTDAHTAPGEYHVRDAVGCVERALRRIGGEHA